MVVFKSLKNTWKMLTLSNTWWLCAPKTGVWRFEPTWRSTRASCSRWGWSSWWCGCWPCSSWPSRTGCCASATFSCAAGAATGSGRRRALRTETAPASWAPRRFWCSGSALRKSGKKIRPSSPPNCATCSPTAAPRSPRPNWASPACRPTTSTCMWMTSLCRRRSRSDTPVISRFGLVTTSLFPQHWYCLYINWSVSHFLVCK